MGDYRWIIGVCLAAVSSVISNLGLNFQKLTHVRLQQKAEAELLLEQQKEKTVTKSRFVTRFNKYKHKDKTEPYAKQPLWILGFGLVWLGSILDFAALGFAAQTIIAPLGSLTLVTNTFFAPYINGEKTTRRDMYSTLVIVAGSVVAVSFGDKSEQPKTCVNCISFCKGSVQIYAHVRFAVHACTADWTLCMATSPLCASLSSRRSSFCRSSSCTHGTRAPSSSFCKLRDWARCLALVARPLCKYVSSDD